MSVQSYNNYRNSLSMLPCSPFVTRLKNKIDRALMRETCTHHTESRKRPQLRPAFSQMLLLCGALFFAQAENPAYGQVQPRLIGEHGEWRAFEAQTEMGRLCFVSSFFTKTTGRGGDLSDTIYKEVAAYISHRPDEQVYAEISFQTFPNTKSEARHNLIIDGQLFELITQKEAAFVVDEDTNALAVAAMKKGISMRVNISVERDNRATVSEMIVDEYSLIGLTRALRLIDKACTAP